MNFTIRFVGKEKHALYVDSKQVGIEQLDAARIVTGVPNLSPNLVSSYVDYRHESPYINVSEDVARQSGLFQESCNITVQVDACQLNKYAFLYPTIHKNNETGEITKVYFKQEISEPQLIIDWIKAGFPLDWTTKTELTEFEVSQSERR